MKHIAFLIVISLVLTASGTFAQKISSLVNIVITDMESKPSAGDKIFFKSETDGKISETISDRNGKAQIRLFNGERYQIKINSFEEASNYAAVDIADADYEMQGIELTIRYSLPKTYTLQNVNFKSGSAVLTQNSYNSLNNLAELLNLKDSLKIELAGHTDNVGKDAENLQLSKKRAEAVRNFLIKKGVPINRLVAKGYGETQPVAYNNTPEGRKENRRTEIRILD